MGGEPIIADSAYRHGINDQDMLHAYAHPIRLFEIDEGFTMVSGQAGPRCCWSSVWSKARWRR